jgi:hypothetical protein
MSNTLRRPMFRGGPVDSYNTGITSGLGETGYADGGRVAAKIGGFFNFSKPGGLLPTASYTGGIPQGGLTGLTQAYQSLSPYIPGPKSLIKGAGPLSIAAAPFYMDKDPLQDNPTEEQFQTTAEKLQQQYYGQPRRKLMEDVLSGTRSRAESPYAGFDYGEAKRQARTAENKYTGADTISTDEEGLAFATGIGGQKMKEPTILSNISNVNIDSEEDEITRQAKLYQKLLGGDEAKSQAIYDALLAASPAFFKGRNLREAAPQVLESINKSGAFDKPRDIKQAAAQLAIQRNILREKSIAEEKARYGYLEAQQGYKSKSVLDKLVKLGAQDNFGGVIKNKDELEKAIPGKFYADTEGTLYKITLDPTSKQKRIVSYPD